MSARSLSVSPKPNTLMRCQARPLVFENKSASSLQVTSGLSLPLRVAVIGNHLPRQCGIATFTTDLCDAIAVEYGAAGVFVVAVNDPQTPGARRKYGGRSGRNVPQCSEYVEDGDVEALYDLRSAEPPGRDNAQDQS